MAMLMFCLPFALVSCGDDDDDNKVHTDTYTWSFTNTTPAASASAEVKAAAALAEGQIDDALVAKFNAQSGWTASKSDRKLVIEGGSSVTNDQLVKVQFNLAVVGLSSAVKEALPNNASVTIKRGSTTVDNAALN